MEAQKVWFDDNIKEEINFIISLLILLNLLVFCGLVVKIYGFIIESEY